MQSFHWETNDGALANRFCACGWPHSTYTTSSNPLLFHLWAMLEFGDGIYCTDLKHFRLHRIAWLYSVEALLMDEWIFILHILRLDIATSSLYKNVSLPWTNDGTKEHHIDMFFLNSIIPVGRVCTMLTFPSVYLPAETFLWFIDVVSYWQ